VTVNKLSTSDIFCETLWTDVTSNRYDRLSDKVDHPCSALVKEWRRLLIQVHQFT